MVIADLGDDKDVRAPDGKARDIECMHLHVSLVRHETTPCDSKRNADIRQPALLTLSVTDFRKLGCTKNRKKPPPPAPSNFPPSAPAVIAAAYISSTRVLLTDAV